jgi:hypothetical protein
VFTNTAAPGATAPAYRAPSTNPFGISDVGISASPALADLDGDGDLDLFIGNRDGNTLVFTNTAAPGATAPAYRAPRTNPLGTTWSYADKRTLTHNQSVSYIARVANAVTNLGPTGTAYTATVDTTGPTSTAAITNVADDFRIRQSTVAAGGTTDDRTPIFAGNISAALATGETVRIFNGTTLLGSATVTGTTWSFTPTLQATASTNYSITARVADAVGNLGTASPARSFTLNTTPTSTAAITNVVDDFRISQSTVAPGGTTDDRTPTFTGTISAALATGETVRIFNGTTLLGSATVDNTAKTWSFTPTLQATASTNYSITARITDEGGNPGSALPARTFTLNNTPTTTATIISVVDNVGTTVTVASGATTDDLTPTISGTLSAALQTGETLRIYNGTALLGNATVTGTSWSYMPTLPATAGTNYTISARVASQDGILGNPSVARTFRLDTSISKSIKSNSSIDNIWTSDGLGPITLLSKFIGFADKGFDIYDTRNGLPSMFPVDIDFKSPTLGGYGAGVKASGSLRAGVDVKLDVQPGTATLELNDAIKWYWANDGNNIILNSAYDYGSSSLMVSSPSLDLYMALRADFDLDVDFQYKKPNHTWTTKDGFVAKNSIPLFERTIKFPDPDLELSMEFAKGQISITVTPPDLDTDKNTQLINGVKSYAESDLVSLRLDIDTFLEENIKLPPPAKLILSEELSFNFGDFEAGVEAYILDAGISETAKLRQEITATVDLSTGNL